MKTRGTKILTAILVIVMIMSFTTAALAESEQDAPPAAKDNEGKSIALLFVKYAPESLADYLSTKSEHEAFHEQRKAENDAFRAQIRTEVDDIIDAFVDGSMTGEEAMTAIVGARDAVKGFRDEAAPVLEAKKAENELLKAQRDSLIEQTKAALTAETVDEELMKSLLEQSLALLKQHLALDYKYAAQLDAVKAKYFPE